MRGLVSDAPLAPDPDVYPIKLLATLLSPVARLAEDVPSWGWAAALLTGTWQYLRHDTFTPLLMILMLAATADYWFGVKVAKYLGTFDPRVAHGGVIGKVAGLTLVLLLRLLEGWLLLAGFVDSRGALATTVALALVTVDLQSIAHHREALGSAPIPILSQALTWLRSLASTKLPPPPGPPDVPR